MGAGHAHTLYHHGHSAVHRAVPEVKLAAAFLFVLAVAVTPRQAIGAFAVDALTLVVLVRLAELPARFVLTRLLVIVPFLGMALLLPFVAGGDRITVGPLGLSREGLWGSWNVLAKAGLGAGVSIVLAGTTEQTRLLAGLERLRVPRTITLIAAFMLRYLTLLGSQVARTRTAMQARGYAPRWLWESRPVASAAGALFVRSYERGERIHAAMLSRGFTGAMPEPDRRQATAGEWLAGAAVALVPATTATLALAAA